MQAALGILWHELRKCGASLVGFVSIKGYDFESSPGVEDGKFMELAIDEMNQPELTDKCIQN
jgi:flavodoxin I